MPEEADDQYLIWSNEHRAWWRADRCGYAPGLRDAGRYTRIEALEICRDSLPISMYVGAISEIPVRAGDITDFLKGQLVPQAVFGGR